MKLSTKLTHMAVALGALALGACNSVDENDRFIELPAIDSQRVVLLEEFTGQLCVNCPSAHEIIEGLCQQYPDNFISVSIHGGGDAFSISEDLYPGNGLRTVEGQQYCDRNNVYSLPAGIVDRTSGVVDMQQWAGIIRSELEKPATMDIVLTASLSADGTAIDVLADIEPFDNVKGNLQLWVVESGVIAFQLKGKESIANYVHNHVFRGTVNGLDGEPVSLTIREPKQCTGSVPVKDTWNVENLSIVGFVYNDQGVLQAGICHVD